MIEQIVIAILVGAIAWLVCKLLGAVLSTLAIPPIVAVGGFLSQFAYVIGVIVGLWYFFTGGGLPSFLK